MQMSRRNAEANTSLLASPLPPRPPLKQTQVMALVDTQAAAVALGVTPRTVQRWVLAGVVPNRVTPRRIRIDVRDVPESLAIRRMTDRRWRS